MEQTVKKTGILKSYSIISEKEKWTTADLILTSGEVIRVLLPKDKLAIHPLSSFVDKENTFNMKGNNWYMAFPLPAKEEEGEGGEGKSTGSSKDKYWEEKTDYEVRIKDRETAIRSLFISVSEFYGKALGHIKQKPGEVAEVNTLLDEAADKARALFNKMRSWVTEENDPKS